MMEQELVKAPHGLPFGQRKRLLGLRGFLENQIIGQSHVMDPLVASLQAGELGLTTPDRPKASFLFLGPTGVGKTETAIAFSMYLFGRGGLARLDMSEFQSQDSVGILLGDSRGNGGLLAQRLKEVQWGRGTLLLDEIEKAHPRVLDLLLQILDTGRIAEANGNTLDLRGFYIVLTSNIASHAVLRARTTTRASRVRFIEAEAQRALRPEIFARLSRVLVFDSLPFEHQMRIAQLMAQKEIDRFREAGLHFQLDPSVFPYLVRKGCRPQLGVRPLRHFIEQTLQRSVSECLLRGGVGRGVIMVEGDELRIR